jgi:transcriptional regulator with XRE-family HTH domain
MQFKPQKIRELLNERKLNDKKFTQGSFLKEVDISLPTLQSILECSSSPNVKTLMKIANYFGKDMNFFFTDDEKYTKKAIQVVSSPVDIYEPPTELKECYKIMFEQQKEITELRVENERLKNVTAPERGAKIG